MNLTKLNKQIGDFMNQVPINIYKNLDLTVNSVDLALTKNVLLIGSLKYIAPFLWFSINLKWKSRIQV